MVKLSVGLAKVVNHINESDRHSPQSKDIRPERSYDVMQ